MYMGRTVPKARGRIGGRTMPSHGGSLGSAPPGFSLTAPVATWISDAATAQAVFEIDVDSGVVSGDKIWGESSTDNFSTILETVSAAIGAPDLADFQIDDFAFSPFTPDGTYYARFWVSNSADVAISPKSTAISLAIVATISRQTVFYSPIYGGICLNENGSRQAAMSGLFLNEGA